MKQSSRIGIFISLLLFATGCAGHKTVTQQIMDQTKDPVLIMQAAYADALGNYVAAQELYKPYLNITRASHPDLAEQIRKTFSSAWKILSDWKKLGTVPSSDEQSFRSYIRELSIQIAKAAEGEK